MKRSEIIENIRKSIEGLNVQELTPELILFIVETAGMVPPKNNFYAKKEKRYPGECLDMHDLYNWEPEDTRLNNN